MHSVSILFQNHPERYLKLVSYYEIELKHCASSVPDTSQNIGRGGGGGEDFQHVCQSGSQLCRSLDEMNKESRVVPFD